MRKTLLAAAQAALTATLALAQQDLPPIPKPEKALPFLEKLLGYGYWIGFMFVIGYALFKILYAYAQRSTGNPGITASAHREWYEAFSAPFWFAITILALPWIIVVLADAEVVPGWLRDEIVRIFLTSVWGFQPPRPSS